MPVYMFHAIGTHTYKIGKSVDPFKRLSSCQSGSPALLELVATMEEPAEDWWHRMFQQHRVHGEWYELGREDVGYFIKLADEVYLRQV